MGSVLKFGNGVYLRHSIISMPLAISRFIASMCVGLIFFHFQKLSAERAGLAELDIVQKEWMAIVPYLLSLQFQKVRACTLCMCKVVGSNAAYSTRSDV